MVSFSLLPNHQTIVSSDKHTLNSTNIKKKKQNPLSHQTSALLLPPSKRQQNKRTFLQRSKVLTQLCLVVHRPLKLFWDRNNHNQLRTYLEALADKCLFKAVYLGTVQCKVQEYLGSKLNRRKLRSLELNPLKGHRLLEVKKLREAPFSVESQLKAPLYSAKSQLKVAPFSANQRLSQIPSLHLNHKLVGYSVHLTHFLVSHLHRFSARPNPASHN